MPLSLLALTIFNTLLGVLGDSFLKLAGRGPRYIDIRLYLLGVGTWLLAGFGWFYLFKQTKWINIGIIYVLTTIIAFTLMSTLYFKEKLTTGEIAGLILAIFAIFLLKKFA